MGLTMEELGSPMGVKASQVEKLEKGQRKLTVQWLERLEKSFRSLGHEVTAFEIIGFKDDDYSRPAPSDVTSMASKGRNSDWDEKPKKKIPMFYAGAGEYMYPSSEPMDWVQPSERFTKTDRQIAFEVKGKSMEPAMWEGDIVYCYWQFDVVQKEAINKRSVVLCEDGRVLIKILEEGEKPGTYDLKSLNGHPPEYGVKLLAAAKIVDIVTK